MRGCARLASTLSAAAYGSEACADSIAAYATLQGSSKSASRLYWRIC